MVKKLFNKNFYWSWNFIITIIIILFKIWFFSEISTFFRTLRLFILRTISIFRTFCLFFYEKFWCFTQLLAFRKFWFVSGISIFIQNFHFYCRFWFLLEIIFFILNFDFLSEILTFYPKFWFLSEISIFYPKFWFLS